VAAGPEGANVRRGAAEGRRYQRNLRARLPALGGEKRLAESVIPASTRDCVCEEVPRDALGEHDGAEDDRDDPPEHFARSANSSCQPQ
jgi:hypothetical protein